MQCNLDKNKVKQGIKNAVIERIKTSNSFTVDNDIIKFIGSNDNERLFINNINKEFKSKVISQVDINKYLINPSDTLTMRYIITQPGSGEVLMNEIRQRYIDQYSKTSLNLTSPDLWLRHPGLQNPNVQDLVKFMLKINPNAKIAVLDDLDQSAVSLIRDHIILIRSNAIISDLPEEVSHFFVELLPDEHPLKQEMMKKIIDFPIYAETYSKYKNDPAYQIDGKLNIDKIKREAIAKQIGEYIKNAWNNTADSKYGEKRSYLRGLIDRFMKWLRETFTRNSPDEYTEPINDPFSMASALISAGDITQLNVKKIPTIYDSVFFSLLAKSIPEGYEANDIVKGIMAMVKGVGSQLNNEYKRMFQDKGYKGLLECLNDPNNPELNRIFSIKRQMDDIGKDMERFAEPDEYTDITNLSDEEHEKLIRDVRTDEKSKLIEVASKIAHAYNELSIIPQAIEDMLSKMQINKTEGDKIIDNIVELQNYAKVSKNVQLVAQSFIKLLSEVKLNKTVEYADEVYNKMMDNIKGVDEKIKLADARILSMVKEHVDSLTNHWTGEAFKKYHEYYTKIYGKVNAEWIKKQIRRELAEKITSPEQIRAAIFGEYAGMNTYKSEEGWDMKTNAINDITGMDFIVAWSTSASLVSDPFISNLMAFYTDHYMVARMKGGREAMTFAQKQMKTKDILINNFNMNAYEIERQIHSVEKFFSYKDTTLEKRCLLSETLRYKFNYDLKVKKENISDLWRQLAVLQSSYAKSKDDTIKTKLTEKRKELDEKRKELREFKEKYATDIYTQEYRDLKSKIEPKEGDPAAVKELKQIEKDLIEVEEAYNQLTFMDDRSISSEEVELFAQERARLQSRKSYLRDLLPERDKEDFKKLEELYDEDKIYSKRLRANHKEKWIRNAVEKRMSMPGNTETANQLKDKAEEEYINRYLNFVPNQEYYDKIDDIWKRINEISAGGDELIALKDQIDELREKEKKIIRNFRSSAGDVTVDSFKFAPFDDEHLLSEYLKFLNSEYRMLTKKKNILSIVFNSNLTGAFKNILKANTEWSIALVSIVENTYGYTIDDVIKKFRQVADLTPVQAQAILSAIKNSKLGDHTELQNLPALGFKFNDKYSEDGFIKLNLSSVQAIIDFEDTWYQIHKSMSGLAYNDAEIKARREKIDSLFNELNTLSSKNIGYNYSLVFDEFIMHIGNYVKSDDKTFTFAKKKLHAKKLINFYNNNPTGATIEAIQELFSDGLFDSTIEYLSAISEMDENLTTTPYNNYSMNDYINFIVSIHEEKTIGVGNDKMFTYSPMRWTMVVEPDINLGEIRYPRFLTKNKVKDKYYTEKLDDLNPEVLSGKKHANIDINGNWLPKYGKELTYQGKTIPNPYHNQRYEDLKNSTDAKSKLIFKYLEDMKLDFLKKQVEQLTEGYRFDLTVPVKRKDNFEQTVQNLTDAKEMWKKIKEINPFINKSDIPDEVEDFREETGSQTIKQATIYGQLMNEDEVKLYGRRNTPVQRTSEDVLASITNFIEEVYIYNAKNYVNPIWKSFVDTFEDSVLNSKITGKEVNVKRASVLRNLYEMKILDKKIQNKFNSPIINEIVSAMSRLAGMRLLGDPLGAMVNYASGEIQNFISKAWEVDEWKSYMQTGHIAVEWQGKYSMDFYSINRSRVTQIVDAFSFLPDKMEISNHLSNVALLVDIKSKLMVPRTVSELILGIHLGLSILRSNPVEFKGNMYNIDDLYTVDSVTNLLELKPEFKELSEKWNPIDGTEVIKMRKLIIQKYTILQGNFHGINQSLLSRMPLGRIAELMKRWFISGMVREFQPETIDPYLGTHRKGQQLAIIHLLRGVFKAIGSGNINSLSEYWNDMVLASPNEKAAIQKATSEAIFLLIIGSFILFGLGYDSDDPDKTKKLREAAYFKQLLLLIAMRVQGEVGTFIPLPILGLGYMEMKRAILDPFAIFTGAGANNVAALGKLIFQKGLYSMGVDSYYKDLYYTKDLGYHSDLNEFLGYRQKEGSKLWSLMLNTIGYNGYTADPVPYITTISNMQNRVK